MRQATIFESRADPVTGRGAVESLKHLLRAAPLHFDWHLKFMCQHGRFEFDCADGFAPKGTTYTTAVDQHLVLIHPQTAASHIALVKNVL